MANIYFEDEFEERFPEYWTQPWRILTWKASTTLWWRGSHIYFWNEVMERTRQELIATKNSEDFLVFAVLVSGWKVPLGRGTNIHIYALYPAKAWSWSKALFLPQLLNPFPSIAESRCLDYFLHFPFNNFVSKICTNDIRDNFMYFHLVNDFYS